MGKETWVDDWARWGKRLTWKGPSVGGALFMVSLIVAGLSDHIASISELNGDALANTSIDLGLKALFVGFVAGGTGLLVWGIAALFRGHEDFDE